MQVKKSLWVLKMCTICGVLVGGLSGILVCLTVLPKVYALRDNFEHIQKFTEARLQLKVVTLLAMDSIVDKSSGEISAERVQALTESKKSFRTLFSNLKEGSRLTDIESRTEKLFNLIENELKNAVVQHSSEATFGELDDRIDALSEEIGDSYALLSNDVSSQFKGSISLLLTVVTLGLVGSFLLAVVVLAIAGSVSKKSSLAINSILISLTKAINEIKAGNFRTVVPYLAWEDEVGGIARAVDEFKKASQEKHDQGIVEAKERELVLERQHRLESAIKSFEGVVGARLGKVSGAGSQLISTASSVTVIIEDAVRETSGISMAASEILDNVQGIAAAAEEMQVSSKVISGQLQTSNKVLAKVVEQNSEATKSAEKLKQVVESVQGVVTFIEGIATQINLLALNASIESARAGEAGKGFAVVASEVKSLASQVANATGDISKKIGSIQQSSNEVIETIHMLEELMEQLSKTSREIEYSLGEQGQAIAEVSRSMSTAVTGVGQISGSVGSIGNATTKTQEGCHQFSSAANALRLESDDLGKVVSKFLGELNNDVSYH